MRNFVIYSIPDLVIFVILKLSCSPTLDLPYLGPLLFPSSCRGAYLTFPSPCYVAHSPLNPLVKFSKPEGLLTAKSFTEQEILFMLRIFFVASDSRGASPWYCLWQSFYPPNLFSFLPTASMFMVGGIFWLKLSWISCASRIDSFETRKIGTPPSYMILA